MLSNFALQVGEMKLARFNDAYNACVIREASTNTLEELVMTFVNSLPGQLLWQVCPVARHHRAQCSSESSKVSRFAAGALPADSEIESPVPPSAKLHLDQLDKNNQLNQHH